MGPLVIMFAFAKPFLSTIPQVQCQLSRAMWSCLRYSSEVDMMMLLHGAIRLGAGLRQAAAAPLFACVAPVAGAARRRTSFGRTAQLQSGTFLGPNCHPVDGNRLVSLYLPVSCTLEACSGLLFETIICQLLPDGGALVQVNNSHLAGRVWTDTHKIVRPKPALLGG